MQLVHHPTGWGTRPQGCQTHLTGSTQQNKPWQNPEGVLAGFAYAAGRLGKSRVVWLRGGAVTEGAESTRAEGG